VESLTSGLVPAVPHITVADVFSDPVGVASLLRSTGAPTGLIGMSVAGADRAVVVYHVDLAPWPIFALAGYPEEHVGVLVTRAGDAYAGPLDGTRRRWKHRYPSPLESGGMSGALRMLGQLCLWYPWDPIEERWKADDGFVAFLEIAHRHLLAEECWRRSGFLVWPGREAPHGLPTPGQAHQAA
jgi:hypothetical protein